MHLTTSHFILVILLLYNIECLAKPIGENDQDDADQTDTPDDEPSGQTDTDVKEALNTKWADVETNRAFEFGTIARQCKQALVQAKVTIQSIMRDALEKLHSKACRTAPDTRRIVNEAMEPWGTQLSTLVNAVRGDIVKISNVYIAYFKLAVARSEIYAPRGAGKLNDLFDKTIAEGLLDINGEKRDPNAVILNNAVRFLSGDLNPAQEMYEELQKLTIDNGDAFEENLEEAINQIETVGKILLDMVDTVEDTTYRVSTREVGKSNELSDEDITRGLRSGVASM
ncbi:uncharacterized protein LOC103517806 [Diaphorina citri]|uniref:Uncharacterized protein LOC103517806 n=1 Tax=Diaphorina citri TaxID=121845 RepID=A0A1S4ELM3_DIACI|nr:uncharacterized protein LOC103517806 [Diaphorina citri]